MVELADTQDLGSCAAMRAGSTPVIRTTRETSFVYQDKRGFLYKRLCFLWVCVKIIKKDGEFYGKIYFSRYTELLSA